MCHTRYTNTTFSLSVSVQTLPFCQAHRSTTPTADVPFRGSKTYSCTGWTVKSLSHLPSQKIKKYISVFKKITLGGPFTKKKCSKFTFLPGLSINYSNSRWLKNLLLILLHQLDCKKPSIKSCQYISAAFTFLQGTPC